MLKMYLKYHFWYKICKIYKKKFIKLLKDI